MGESVDLTIHGRGAAHNPANRFERLAFVPDLPPALDVDEEEDGDAAGPSTVYLKDTARSIIAHNDSPDVGFTHSINPYRGCSHGCIYCLGGDTPILMGDGRTKALADVRVGDEIYGTVRRGRYRRYVRTTVSAHWRTEKPAYRLTLEDGTTIVASGDHRFLSDRGWKFVTRGGAAQRPFLTSNNKLIGTGAFATLPAKCADYRRGYLCGLVKGDGHLAEYHYGRAGRAHGNQYQFRLALADAEPLAQARNYLAAFGVETGSFVFQQASERRRAVHGIRTHARLGVDAVRTLAAWQDDPPDAWQKGFLAGVFDAEGCYSGGILRICNTDAEIIRRLGAALHRFGFNFVTEPVRPTATKPLAVVRLLGGLKEHLRFFHTTDPAIVRKRSIEGQAVKSQARLGVVSIEPLGASQALFDITTGTGDFIANGVVSHNCYARPTHAFVGFSPGLDFETKILVKEDAPELLRKELSSPRYKPTTLSISGVTDCYQPAERQFRLTRRCLEVLAECRNPAGIITKSHLVTRDVDVLSELARFDAAVVILSITTLDPELSRRMEPRAASPQRRLAAVEAMAKAGVPVGVMVAPVVPGLTDHETASILKAAAGAGAQFCGFVPVRLPLEVAPLFEDWLARHYPDRKDKVLNRIRDLRGGKLNDSNFHTRMVGQGVWSEQMKSMFDLAKRKAGLDKPFPELSTEHFRPPRGPQMTLFG